MTIAYLPSEHWPYYAPDEVEAVATTLRSGKVNQWTSDAVFRFEDACRARLGGGPGIALANGSLAIELALRAFGIGPGDEVIVTPRSFMASATSANLVGATPVFADVDPLSGNLSAETIAPHITSATRAIIPVHLAGWPCDMAPIMALADAHGLIVIEDCAQAHGAEIDGRRVGEFGHAAAFSFCQDKIISTGGEGGYVSFQDPERAAWAWSFKDHGKNRAKLSAPPEKPGYRYIHDSVGTNWRLTAMQAELGSLQLGKLDEWLERRAGNAAIWSDALRGVNTISVPRPPANMRHAWYRLYAYLDGEAEAVEQRRNRILEAAAAEGLRLSVGSGSELYREAAFDGPKPDLPVTRRLGQASLAMELHPTLDPDRLARRAARLAELIAAV